MESSHLKEHKLTYSFEVLKTFSTLYISFMKIPCIMPIVRLRHNLLLKYDFVLRSHIENVPHLAKKISLLAVTT